MASINIDLDVDLEEFDLDELLDEIDNRFKDKRNQDLIKDWVLCFDFLGIKNNNPSLLDEMKIDFLKKNIDKITLNQLENLL